MRGGRADPAGRGVRLTTLRCAPRSGLWVLVGEVCPAKAEEIDAAWLLPIFKFSAPCGTRWVTSSKPLLGLTLCSPLKPKKPPDLAPYFCRGGVVNNTSVLQTACHECNPPWQKKASAPLRCPWISESFPAVMDVIGGHSSGKYTSIRGSSLQFMNFRSFSGSLITFLWEVWHINVLSSSKEIQFLTVPEFQLRPLSPTSP